jgi:hypothetical protein
LKRKAVEGLPASGKTMSEYAQELGTTRLTMKRWSQDIGAEDIERALLEAAEADRHADRWSPPHPGQGVGTDANAVKVSVEVRRKVLRPGA